jgi:hypothetical protein
MLRWNSFRSPDFVALAKSTPLPQKSACRKTLDESKLQKRLFSPFPLTETDAEVYSVAVMHTN